VKDGEGGKEEVQERKIPKDILSLTGDEEEKEA